MRFIEPDALYAEPVDQRFQSLVDVSPMMLSAVE